MIINTKTYALPDNNYIKDTNHKSYIIFGHTSTLNMNHYIGWLNRYRGKYQKTSSFTISLDGVVYQHFNPRYQSKYFNNVELDRKSIVILLENEGYLTSKDESGVLIGWLGDIYNRNEAVVNKKWRGYEYWAPYTEKQMESAIELSKMLCSDFSIPKTAMDHNTRVDNFGDYAGVLYKSNLDRLMTDLSAAWDYTAFKNGLEN